jgi:hypothetical protein
MYNMLQSCTNCIFNIWLLQGQGIYVVKMLQAKAEYETLNDTARHEMQLTA